MGFSTETIHGSREPEDRTGALVSPIHLSTTFARPSVDVSGGYTYARDNNPTRERLENLIARLERASHGIAFSSGMAAITAVFSLFRSGEHFLVTDNVYSGTFLALKRICEHTGVVVSYIDSSNLVALRQAITDRTRLIFIETPTNPLLRISDIGSIAEAKREHDILFCVDNSIMTPYLQQPLELGADLVLHSTSKYFSGHNDSMGGVIATSDDRAAAELRRIQSVHGAVLNPFDCWLLMRGIKTLALRMDRHSANGRLVAEYLSNHKHVDRVFYPGLTSHPCHELARRQCRGFGGVVSFNLVDPEMSVGFLNNLRLFVLAEGVGGVESVACHPYSMTFGRLADEEKERLGISPQLLRLSAGAEDIEDLIEDIDTAFSKAGG